MEERKLKIYTGNLSIDARLLVEYDKQPFIQLLYEGFDSGRIEGEKIYRCMVTLHEMLDKRNAKLLCNGFRYDVRPSGMSLDMGHGVKAYKMVMGQPAKELVHIFDPTEDVDAIVSVEEQKEYYKRWLASLSG